MSRHRNIRNLTEDDYYDGYDDDDYYDDYYDEDDDYYEPKPKPKPIVPKKAPPKKVTTNNNNNKNKKSTPSTNNTTSKKTTVKTATPKKTSTTSTATTTAVSSRIEKWKREKQDLILELQQQQQQQEKRKKQLSVVLFGHVDAGKSTLLGQLLVVCGMVSQKVVQEYEMEASLYHSKKTSFAYAWILDSSQEERERGVTMNVTSRQLTYNDVEYTLLDAPGHEELIPILMTGCTSQADVGLLILNASTIKTLQISLTSCEHLSLARALGIPKLIIVLNQCDTHDFDESLITKMIDIIQPYIRQNGYSIEATPIIPISAYHNINLLPNTTTTTTIPSTLSSWYKGTTLLSTLESVGLSLLEQRQEKVWNTFLKQPTRILVSDMTTSSNNNKAVMDGRVLQGCCFPHKDIFQILPSGQYLSCISSTSVEEPMVPFQGISSLQLQLLPSSNNSNSNEQVDLETLIRPGTILIDPISTDEKVLYSKFQVQLSFVSSPKNKTLIVGSQLLFHMHSLQLPCTITKLQEKRRTISYDQQQTKPFTVELTLCDNQSIVASTYVDCKALGRFILRKHGTTIAFGIITQTIS